MPHGASDMGDSASEVTAAIREERRSGKDRATQHREAQEGREMKETLCSAWE